MNLARAAIALAACHPNDPAVYAHCLASCGETASHTTPFAR